MEIQLLHYNTKYMSSFSSGSDDDAFEDYPDAAAIFSVMIEMGKHNEALDPLIKSNCSTFLSAVSVFVYLF